MFLVYPPQTHWHFKFGELLLALFLHTYLLTCVPEIHTRLFCIAVYIIKSLVESDLNAHPIGD